MSLFDERLDMHTVLARTQGLWSIGNLVDQRRCDGNVLLQLIEIDFVVSVRAGVIVLEVVGLDLVRDKIGNTLKQEVKIVGANKGVSGQLGRAPGLEWS